MANFIFVQARMGSSRLHGKTLKEILGKPMLAYSIDRLKLVANVEDVAVLASDSPPDDVIERWCIDNNVSCFRGSERNVLDRYYQAAKHYGVEHVIRATGDNPFVEPYCATILLETHLSLGVDYSSNKAEIGSRLPDGLGTEIFSFEALERSFLNSTKPNHFEHVNEYILENPGEFKIHKDCMAGCLVDRSHIRLTVDTRDDFERAKAIISSSRYCSDLSLDELIRIVDECIA